MHCLRWRPTKLNIFNEIGKGFIQSRTMSQFLQPYEAPEWASKIDQNHVPRFKVELANPNTPVHEWKLPGLSSADVSVSIKRDDMTGVTLSGNKVRKLEFLMADAITKGCSHVITCGGIQSNHCRAVAVSARQLGLEPHLVLRSDVKDVNEVGCSGNVLLDRMCGAHLYMVPRIAPYVQQLKPRMEQIAEKIKEETGEKAYLIPVGGSNSVGMFGYLNVFQELLQQGALDKFDDIVFACGSGGTASGLCIGNYLTGSKLRIHGIVVSDDAKYYYEHVNETLQDVGLTDVKAEDIVDIVEGYKGKGYAISTEEQLKFSIEVSTQTGIMCDPVYTGKAVYGMVQEINKNKKRFKGNRILFLHTGGIYGLFDGRMGPVLERPGAITNRVKMWLDFENSPL